MQPLWHYCMMGSGARRVGLCVCARVDYKRRTYTGGSLYVIHACASNGRYCVIYPTRWHIYSVWVCVCPRARRWVVDMHCNNVRARNTPRHYCYDGIVAVPAVWGMRVCVCAYDFFYTQRTMQCDTTQRMMGVCATYHIVICSCAIIVIKMVT